MKPDLTTLAFALVVAIVCTIAASVTAARKRRSQGWVVGTIFFTPLFLFLLFLPTLEPSGTARSPTAFEIITALILAPLAILSAINGFTFFARHRTDAMPDCDSRIVADATIKALEKDDPDIANIGVTGVSNSHQVFATKNTRQCRAMVNFKDSTFDRVLIDLEKQGATWTLEVSYAD